MLLKANKLAELEFLALDGEIGKFRDFLFNDRFWNLRYLHIRAGDWLTGQDVLISAQAMQEPNWVKELLPVKLTLEQIGACPLAESEPPVSRQADVDGSDKLVIKDPHLRSMNEVRGYSLLSGSDKVGELTGFLLEYPGWQIRYLVVETGGLLRHKDIVLPSKWIESIDHHCEHILTEVSRAAIDAAPEYLADELFDRRYESELHAHYKRVPYWEVRNDSAMANAETQEIQAG